MALTLAEAAKLSNDVLITGVAMKAAIVLRMPHCDVALGTCHQVWLADSGGRP